MRTDQAAPTVESALHDLGLSAFRPGQREVIADVLAGRDALAVMPTGAGKSLCYQLPSLLLPGVSLVVSPLLALMRDQVARAAARGLPALSLTSGDDAAEKGRKLRSIAQRETRLVYAAPEGLRSGPVLTALREAGVALLCIDEAHCISAWGHDFRADYARLGGLREAVGPGRVLALTATATAQVQGDILRGLRMTDPAVHVLGFDRPNLTLRVELCRAAAARRQLMDRTLARALGGGGSAIIYCSTRRHAEAVAGELNARGKAAVAYHAGLPLPAREDAQGAWERGEVPVICATNAFGMGVDKPDVRAVIHHGLPRSPEAYYQEVGRAGRDGQPAVGLLLYDAQDLALARQRLVSSCPTGRVVRAVYARCAARTDDAGFTGAGPDALAEAFAPEVGPQARAALVHLQRLGVLVTGAGGLRVTGGPVASLDVREDLLDSHRQHEEARLAAMDAYVRHARCRRAFLVQYFSGVAPPPCGSCDVCGEWELAAPTAAVHGQALAALGVLGAMRGRFGRGRVVEVLTGSQARGIVAARLDRVPGFGALQGTGRDAVNELLQALERAGLSHTLPGEYPTVALTPEGERALREGQVPPLWQRRGAPEPAGVTRTLLPTDDAEGDPTLVSALRQWRTARARELRVPPYVLFQDRTLYALASLRPRTRDELQQVPGLGAARLRRYGDDILEVLRGA